MQYIELKGMNFHAYHGVMEQERKIGNTFTVDVKLYVDLRKGIASDNLTYTVNYASVYEVIKKEMAIPSNLIEHVAGRIVERIRKNFPTVEQVEIRLAKKNPPIEGDIQEVAVGVE
ncbi:MAG: dihydroneopterin aldolase [Dysgonamonadaceae bacterium]|jgi:dihydroneopterin aldolase|nr:dihydroneopterin aldolase [Dysgonamonadaceae bacterium]